MSDPTSFHLVAAGVHLVPALVWSVIALESWRARLGHRPRATLFRVLPILTSLFALHFFLHALIELTPTELGGRAPGLHDRIELLTSLALVALAPLFRHLVPLLPLRGPTPSRTWLAANYGSAALVAALLLLTRLVPAFQAWRWSATQLAGVYEAVMLTLGILEARRLMRRGSWQQGISVAEIRSPDMVVMIGALVGMGAMLFALAASGTSNPSTTLALFLHTALGLALAVPFAVRMLGRVVREMLLGGTLIALTVAVWFGGHAAAAGVGNPELGRLIDLLAVALLLVFLVPGQAGLRAVIDHLVFRRGRRRAAELRAAADTLSPAFGVAECCGRGLHALSGVMRFRGAAIVLSGGAGTIAEGTIATARLEQLLAGAEERLPARPLMEIELRELPDDLREALIEARVARTFPILSPRRRWGHVLATEALLAAPFDEADIEAIVAFLAQLALVLDGAELLARATAVERSLAHAEKLAAIGELAARIAHEIRNPITAARSLAQQLAHEPGSPFAVEHGLILLELERVERQVASLLRFARREEFRFGRVDLGELVAHTIADLRPRLDDAGIDVTLVRPVGLTSRADPEKIRQVLVNLIENAIDALRSGAGSRRIDVDVSRRNGSAAIRVTDSGPGVPPDALGRLFEPFFSLKEHGTGLGLAIAKRTIDAHGGRIAAAASPRGMSFEIELPLDGERSEIVEHATGGVSP